MRKRSKRKGFTLIELTVVIGIIILLTGIGLLSYKALLDKTRKIACDTNLRAINLALNMYLNDYGRFPSTGSDLVRALSEYNISPSQFHCVEDPVKNHNTYLSFYLQRSTRPDNLAFVLGCPYHSRGEKSLALLYGDEPKELENLKVTLNGSPTKFGQSMSLRRGDEIDYQLKDGNTFATVNVTQNIDDAAIIAAFSLPSGKPYGILKINDEGAVDVQVRTGSRFEVATPSTIAGVQGTRFTVTVSIEDDDYVTTIDVTEGTVVATTFPETIKALKDSTEIRKIKFPIEAGHTGTVRRRIPYYVPHRIKIVPRYIRLKVGQTVKFEVIGYDKDGQSRKMGMDDDDNKKGHHEDNEVEGEVEWTLFPYLWPSGRLDDDGNYTAIRRGVDKIRAKVGPRKAYAYIFVR